MVKTIYSQVARDATVLQMMQKIHKKKGIPIHEMQLSYNNSPLEEDQSLAHYGIYNGAHLTLKVIPILKFFLLQLFSSYCCSHPTCLNLPHTRTRLEF
jgi:hypothetical protein